MYLFPNIHYKKKYCCFHKSKSSNMRTIDSGTEHRTNTRDQPSPDHQI